MPAIVVTVGLPIIIMSGMGMETSPNGEYGKIDIVIT